MTYVSYGFCFLHSMSHSGQSNLLRQTSFTLPC
jgi:hypothetical protein